MSLTKRIREGMTFAAFCKFLGIKLPAWADLLSRRSQLKAPHVKLCGRYFPIDRDQLDKELGRCTALMTDECFDDPTTTSTEDLKPGTPTGGFNENATTIGGVTFYYQEPTIATLPDAEKLGAWRSVWPDVRYRSLQQPRCQHQAPAIKRRALVTPRNRDPPG